MVNTIKNRIRTVKTLHTIALDLERNKEKWISALVNIETKATAVDEVDKTIRALKTYHEELEQLEGRNSVGFFRVSLPFNNPLYSFVLYSCGISLAGNRVLVRPSRMTAKYVKDFFKSNIEAFHSIGIFLFDGTGSEFINQACNQTEAGGLLFTGSYSSLLNISYHFPENQHLIYCGQGMNPLVVGKNISSLPQCVSIAVNSRIYNSGQDCLCSEKIIVHEDVFEDFCAELKKQLDKLSIGIFGDQKADIFPPLIDLQETIQSRYETIRKEGNQLYERIESDAVLAVFEVSIDSQALNSEKFCPIFTIAKYRDEKSLDPIINSDYKFGAILLGDIDRSKWSNFPHVVTDGTVIEIEGVSAHVPFGGRGKSGFSMHNNYYNDGPILFSLETSQ